jgi:hypothetical protein
VTVSVSVTVTVSVSEWMGQDIADTLMPLHR